jgi:hypothetical protein
MERSDWLYFLPMHPLDLGSFQHSSGEPQKFTLNISFTCMMQHILRTARFNSQQVPEESKDAASAKVL